jgi:hypothetical protein
MSIRWELHGVNLGVGGAACRHVMEVVVGGDASTGRLKRRAARGVPGENFSV